MKAECNKILRLLCEMSTTKLLINMYDVRSILDSYAQNKEERPTKIVAQILLCRVCSEISHFFHQMTLDNHEKSIN